MTDQAGCENFVNCWQTLLTSANIRAIVHIEQKESRRPGSLDLLLLLSGSKNHGEALGCQQKGIYMKY